MSEPTKIRFKLSPEMADGTSYTVVDSKEALLEAVTAWADEAKDTAGETMDVTTVAMTDEEVDALPEV